MKEPPFTHVQKPPIIRYFAVYRYDSEMVRSAETAEEAVKELADAYMMEHSTSLDEDDVIVYGATAKAKSVKVNYEVDFG